MTLSDDGNWLWNGQEWVPAPGAERVSKSILKTVVPSFLIVTSLLFVILSPSLSPIQSIKDSDGDGYADDIDVFDSNPREWFDTDGDGLGNNQDDCPDQFGDSTIDRIGCQDFDSDGYSDLNDSFPLDPSEWLDSDEDGWGDNQDDCDNQAGDSYQDQNGCLDSDSDGWSDEGDPFPTDETQWMDTDGDGWGDNQSGNDPDEFPFDGTEWKDVDGDGIGDNQDPDDDNDGYLDTYDVNPGRDAAIFLNLSTFIVHDSMDYFDSYSEIYFCVYINNFSQGCVPDQNSYWSLTTGDEHDVATSFYFDLDEGIRHHYIEIEAWDSDAFADDLMDISDDSNLERLVVDFDSVEQLNQLQVVGDGTQDSNGWDGELALEIVPFDSRTITRITHNWDFDDQYYQLDIDLDYQTYVYYRSLDHSIDWSGYQTYDDVIDQYARFSTPDAPYIVDLATTLKSMANQAGYASSLGVADFIHAFVGDIQYLYDLDDAGEQSEYPKYPIEMLWEQGGDCEDGSALYISLMEALGYDAALMLGLVKPNSEEDWGGHAWPVLYLPDHSGDGWYGEGAKSSLPFYFVESTAHSGYSSVGINPWYDLKDEVWYDIE